MAVVTRSRGSSKLKPEPCVHPAAPARVQLTRPNFRRGAGRICIACARSLPSPWSAMRTDDPGTGTIPASATTFRRRAHGICAQKAREVTPPVRAGPCRPFPPRRATGQGGPVRLATRLLPLVVFKAAPDGRSASSCDWEPLPFWAGRRRQHMLRLGHQRQQHQPDADGDHDQGDGEPLDLFLRARHGTALPVPGIGADVLG
jgi:hypothetical protein